eukprot:CAMPEP_0172882496 /NCGR_PEP_ID=MMETSP1075-20121228/120317_1 /TAXON_ID=2916 /ORGANISM="Ceratium fusus, Strain PA161109" /LENGTH=99 /DNA_ID=CAMNT_0013735183 /DNA_START=443 /DNA_END=739 /DNA_ORIENTATION=+
MPHVLPALLRTRNLLWVVRISKAILLQQHTVLPTDASLAESQAPATKLARVTGVKLAVASSPCSSRGGAAKTTICRVFLVAVSAQCCEDVQLQNQCLAW